jgi:amidase
MSVQGAITREVRDLRLATRVMAAPDARDPWQVPVPFDGPAIDPPIKVALVRATNGYAIDPAITAALERSATYLEQAGYRIEEVDPPLLAEAARDALPCLFGESKIMLGGDIQKYGSATIRRMFDEYFEVLGSYEPLELIHAMGRRSRYTRAWNVFMQDYPLLLTPFMMRPTYEWDEDARGKEIAADIFHASVYSWTINFLGLPAAIAPAGLHNGLPVSVQIIGQRYREDLCIDAAEVLERASGVQVYELWRREGWM